MSQTSYENCAVHGRVLHNKKKDGTGRCTQCPVPLKVVTPDPAVATRIYFDSRAPNQQLSWAAVMAQAKQARRVAIETQGTPVSVKGGGR